MVIQLENEVVTRQNGRTLRQFSLEDKYTLEDGLVLLSGIQALVRLPIDQHRADIRQGLNTATLISGYRGSPLGGLDLTLERNQKHLVKHQIVFVSGVNEEMGATAVWGSQTANLLPEPKYDGVLGMWYGKAPGVDRTGDVFKHANFTGVGRYGGVLAIAGDDPTAKSSTLPSHTEVSFYDAMSPVLFPGNAQEVLDLGRLGFELSRYSGLWTGFKVVANVADEFSTVEVARDRITVQTPEFLYQGRPWQHQQNTNLLSHLTLGLERELYEGRLEAVRRFASVNPLNQITVPTYDAWLGIVAAGKTYYDLRQALHELGLDDDELRHYGIRILKLGMLYPIQEDIVCDFAEGLEEILVIEEKRGFVEMLIRDVLYGKTERPRVVGKRDEDGDMLVKPYGGLETDDIIPVVANRIGRRIALDSIAERLEVLDTPPHLGTIPLIPRSPFFCSGCPHNRSTAAPDGALVGGGIGCHTMLLLMPNREVTGITAMGGEGVQWVGAAPFSNADHIFQNLGDGTLFHSGTLAIRQAVASGVNITYKILYNAGVAMTGGQEAAGSVSVSDLTMGLKAEGVAKIIVTSDQPGKYPSGTRWAEGVEIWHRDRLDEAHQVLQDVPGVTVLIHDQDCANELRRKRRRGTAPDPELRVFINEAVCEGCGDCGVKSNCMSVQPVDTEFGRKTQVHQPSCNKDYSCIQGDCPAFVSVIPKGKKAQQHAIDFETMIFPEPEYRTNGECNLYMMGIGGMGVVTTNQIVALAACLDGKFVRGLDQTGLSQKGGPVVANLKIIDGNYDRATRVSAGSADGFLVFDLLTAMKPDNLSRANKDRTVAVISTSEVPTGHMAIDTSVQYPNGRRLIDTVHKNTRLEDNVVFDATRLAETLFGSHMPTNLIVVGAAYQRGLIPIRAEAIERAITVNGVAVKANIDAFRAGRRAVVEPEWAQQVVDGSFRAGDMVIEPEIMPEAEVLIDRVGADGELLRLLRIRVPELISYQNIKYARQYVDFVAEVYEAEQRNAPAATRLSEAVARYLFKLMAYKDEYEVSRLHSRKEAQQALNDLFGPQSKIHYLLLPPTMRAVGLKRKLKLGRWFDPFHRLLIRMKFLRGTPFDPFAYAKVRRVERQLIGQYCDLLRQGLVVLSPETYDKVVELAGLPDIIRGYEDIKLENVEKFWREVEQLGFSVPLNRI